MRPLHPQPESRLRSCTHCSFSNVTVNPVMHHNRCGYTALGDLAISKWRLSAVTCRLPWGEGLLGLGPTQEDRSPVTGQLLFRGLSAKVGIFHGPIVKLCPHSTTGEHQLHTTWLTKTWLVGPDQQNTGSLDACINSDVRALNLKRQGIKQQKTLESYVQVKPCHADQVLLSFTTWLHC